ncbi:ATP-dependent RNA helicase DDX50 [Porphyridium purpureum]|uniref:ATP-dependent RNA helicase DDX50 n=1 Tax=Porphyridium purpureum TaxID=35688 RepID=A0A5J4YRM0_PORPP|nr:ATP-dependent RNA helicase DDX50 [Porphyridium purpureum]|eukprot:POR5726..scf229_5
MAGMEQVSAWCEAARFAPRTSARQAKVCVWCSPARRAALCAPAGAPRGRAVVHGHGLRWRLVREQYGLRCVDEKHAGREAEAQEVNGAGAEGGPENDAPGLSFDEMGRDSRPLSEKTRRLLQSRGFERPTLVQARAFDPITEGRNVVLRAVTGTGKTLAYALPIVERLVQEKQQGILTGKGPFAVILVPTRELALQVLEDLEYFALPHGLSTCCMIGSVPKTQQLRQLRAGVDIAIGTPGRVQDHLSTERLNLIDARFAVLDEADEMFDLGFGPEVDSILLNTTARVRQTILVSATIPKWVETVAARFQKAPVLVNCVTENENRTPERVTHYAVQVPEDLDSRTAMASEFLESFLPLNYGEQSAGSSGDQEDEVRSKRAIVFVDSQSEANALGKPGMLARPAIPLHGGLSQLTREQRLARFKRFRRQPATLVATNVASRGLDIANIELVIQCRLPRDKENYIHRVGRTARAGRAGTSIVFFSESEMPALNELCAQTRVRMNVLKPTRDMIERAKRKLGWRLQQVEQNMELLPWLDDEERAALEADEFKRTLSQPTVRQTMGISGRYDPRYNKYVKGVRRR